MGRSANSTKIICSIFFLLLLLFQWNDSKQISISAKQAENTGNFETTFDYQRAILNFPVRDKKDKSTWIQGASVNQLHNEIYVSRQSNGGTVLTIERRNMENGEILDTRNVSMKSGTYVEGLPWFFNKNGELCFFVRRERANKISIYNYKTNIIEKNFSLSGDYKLGFGLDKKYLISSTTKNNRIETVYLYDFTSAVSGKPKLLKKIDTSKADLWFEKPQGITVHDDKIYFSHGGAQGNPAVSVVDMNGKVEKVYDFDRNSYADMINVGYPYLITDKVKYKYENEGIFMYTLEGTVYLGLVQIVNGTTTVIVLAGDSNGNKVKTIK